MIVGDSNKLERLKYENIEESIVIANELYGSYDKQVLFHCYWNGDLNEKHLYSIMSFYLFNVVNKRNKIILWIENNIPNKFNEEIKKYAEIKNFSLENEFNNLDFIIGKYNSNYICYYSDFVRLLLLYNYGGLWFDLDCFF